MKKISFKNPKGGTIYLAKVGFDWGAFWGMMILAGLPFFLRKMNRLGWFCLVFLLIRVYLLGILNLMNFEVIIFLLPLPILAFLIIAFALYLGVRGGKLTARHYLEEGYECITKDEALLKQAKAKWDMEF